MKLVIVESPFMYQDDNEDLRAIGQLRNITYARLALSDCLFRGEAPYASHLLLTQPFVLDDDDANERKLGIDAGLDWGDKADASVFYTDLGISTGMKYGKIRADKIKRPYEERTIEGWENALDESPKTTLVRLELYTEQQLSQYIKMKKLFNGLDTEMLLKP